MGCFGRVFLTTFAFAVCAVAPAALADARLDNARELLGKAYRHSPVKHSEQVSESNHLVRLEVHKSLRAKWQPQADLIARTIIQESQHYKLDPFLLMAVIAHESKWNPLAVGEFTEIGLMQVKPKTAEWICGLYGLSWSGSATLRDPVMNIRIGAAYIHYLREEFDSQGKLYLAAYNMGPKNVQKAIDRRKMPKDYSSHVMKQYISYYEDLRDRFEEPSADPDIF